MLTLENAQTIVATVLAKGRELGLKPLTVAVLDAGGYHKAMAREDGTSTLRPAIAQGKANGAIALGIGSRTIFLRAQEHPYLIQAMNALTVGLRLGQAMVRDVTDHGLSTFWRQAGIV